MTARLLVLLSPLAGILVLPAMALAAPVPSPTPSPSPPAVRAVQIEGGTLTKAIVFQSNRDPEREALVRSEVDWLASHPIAAGNPIESQLGPKFSVTLSVDGKPTDVYELYPLAVGGPRVFRPAEQPGDREVREGWFYGRLTMPATLASVGVPIAGMPAEPGGGGGGGVPASEPPDLQGLLGNWANFMGLNIAVIILVAAGVFALAYVLRRQA